jgi:hypothetical protein
MAALGRERGHSGNEKCNYVVRTYAIKVIDWHSLAKYHVSLIYSWTGEIPPINSGLAESNWPSVRRVLALILPSIAKQYPLAEHRPLLSANKRH